MARLGILIERFYSELWNRADESVARQILHPDFDFRGSLGPAHTGPDGFLSYMRATRSALDGFTCTIEDLIEAGDRAAARVHFAGIHRAPLFGYTATGKSVQWVGAAFFTGDGQKITRLWILGDLDSLRQQLGAPSTKPFG